MSVAVSNVQEPHVSGAERKQTMRITATGTTGSITVGFAQVREILGLEAGTFTTAPVGTAGGATTISFANLTNARTYSIEIIGL